MEAKSIMTQVVYGIYNSIQDKWYIGSTRQPNNKRRNEHFSKLRNNTHENKRLQDAANICGVASFEYFILEEFEDTYDDYSRLLKLEEEYIKEFDSFNNGYNNTESTSCAMFTLGVRSKHWGELHGGSKYTNLQIEEVFNLLYSTSKLYKEIEYTTGVDINTISYIKTGGHEWIHIKYPEKSKTVLNRSSIKEDVGILYSNYDILNAFQMLLNNPKDSFEILAVKCGVKLETLSAISSGRQFYKLIIETYGSIAEEYYQLGRRDYAKKYLPPSWLPEADSILVDLHTYGYRSRDKLASKLGLKTANLVRSILELDLAIWSQVITWTKLPDTLVSAVLLLISDRPRASIVTKDRKMILLEKFNKDNREPR